jgi:hypothetical protein
MKVNRWIAVALAILMVASCKIRIVVPEGGSVTTSSGAYTCAAGKTCNIDVVDLFFDETFNAVPANGYEFSSWKKRAQGFCGGKSGPCRLYTSGFEGNEALMHFLENDEVFYLQPVFELTNVSMPAHLYAVNNTNAVVGAQLLKINPVNGAVISTTNFRYHNSQGYADLAFVGDQLYGTNRESLLKLNLQSQEYEFVGNFGTTRLDLIASNGRQLYGVARGERFYMINKDTGFASLIVDVDQVDINVRKYYGLAFHPDGRLFALVNARDVREPDNADPAHLVIIDPNTGKYTSYIGMTGTGIEDSDFQELAFTKEGLIALTEGGGLAKINVSTGNATPYAAIAAADLSFLDGIASK